MPFRLEGGTPNFVGLVGLKEGVEFVSRMGIHNIRQHGQNLISHLIHTLEDDKRFILYGPRNRENCSPILSLNIKGMEPQVVGTILDESFGFAVRSGLHCAPSTHKEIGSFPQGTVRISPGFFNTEDDVAQVALALKEIASSVKVTT
jgi:selenocysteine lyase/cysteine desulfurase